MNDDMSLGDILRQARIEKGLTMDKLIEDLGRKYSKSYIGYVEIGNTIPSGEFLGHVAKVLGLEAIPLLELAIRTKVESYEEKTRNLYIKGYQQSQNKKLAPK